MNWGGPEFVIALCAIGPIAWLANNWIRARHGYPIEDKDGKLTHRPDAAEAIALREENERLNARLGQFEDRMRSLEAIVTDKGYDVATQIEALRDGRKIDKRLIEAGQRETLP